MEDQASGSFGKSLFSLYLLVIAEVGSGVLASSTRKERDMTNVRCWLLWLLSPLLCSDSNGVKGGWSRLTSFFDRNFFCSFFFFFWRGFDFLHKDFYLFSMGCFCVSGTPGLLICSLFILGFLSKQEKSKHKYFYIIFFMNEISLYNYFPILFESLFIFSI